MEEYLPLEMQSRSMETEENDDDNESEHAQRFCNDPMQFNQRWRIR